MRMHQVNQSSNIESRVLNVANMLDHSGPAAITLHIYKHIVTFRKAHLNLTHLEGGSDEFERRGNIAVISRKRFEI